MRLETVAGRSPRLGQLQGLEAVCWAPVRSRTRVGGMEVYAAL